jgi:7,8-dihydroneopterin aldolase/epimerase/oxygenase
VTFKFAAVPAFAGMTKLLSSDSRFPIPDLMDTVFIEDLRIETVIGIYDWERKIRQVVALDLEMAFDNRKPAASDRIDDTLDYKKVAKRLIAFVESSHFELVETLAERCAEIVQNEFGVPWLRLKLSKPGAVRGSKAVGVAIERGKEPA